MKIRGKNPIYVSTKCSEEKYVELLLIKRRNKERLCFY